MESKEREELIRRYCKLSAVPMPAILTTFAVPLVWLVLVMTDEIRFNSTGIYYPGLYVCLGLTAAMLGLFLWSLITLVKGMDKPEWKEIEGDRTVHTAGTSWLSQNLSAGARRRAYRAAKQYGIQVPAENGVTVMVVLLPLLILCGSFVPEYLNSIAEQKQIIQIVGAAETKIKTVFEKQNYRVIVTDPSVTQTHEYSVICTRETSDDAYTSLYLNRYGQIESVHYHLLADTSLDQTGPAGPLQHRRPGDERPAEGQRRRGQTGLAAGLFRPAGFPGAAVSEGYGQCGHVPVRAGIRPRILAGLVCVGPLGK
jgi:hypothetical protein